MRYILALLLYSQLLGCSNAYQVVWKSDTNHVDAVFYTEEEAKQYVEYYKHSHDYVIKPVK